MTMVYRTLMGLAAGFGLFVGTLVQASDQAAPHSVDYVKQIKPLLKARCYACHGALKQEASLRLDTAVAIRLGGDSGAAVNPGKQAADSLLLERVSSPDVSDRMPPEHEGEPFSAAQIELLRVWIAAGAQGPEDEQPEADPLTHWAFRPVAHLPVPAVKNTNWVRNPIDAWISQQHEQQGLRPQFEASRLELVRRLYLDLIGLPPNPEELTAAMENSSPDWYEETVDRLLEDPRHGERWARHWMDNWRYSDWWGLNSQLRNSQRHIWHWRDWIVESLNEDVPYDRMVRLMLAGDELVPEDADQLRATGYLARNYYIFNRQQWMEQTVEHVGKGFLGLTLNCAKCHDHKFDPIEQTDYYKFRAFFEPYLVRQDLIPGEIDLMQDSLPRVFDGLLDAPTWKFIRGDDSKPDKSQVIAPGVPEVLKFAEVRPEQITLPPVSWDPARRPGVLETYLQAAQSERDAARTKFVQARKNLEQLEQNRPADTLSPAVQSSALAIQDRFSEVDPRRWQTLHGNWTHHAGRLEQNEISPRHSLIQLLPPAPVDFEARIRFRITGGDRWRSVGLAFDAAPGSSTGTQPETIARQMVYVSGAHGDSKVQGAYQQQGKWNYPSVARKKVPVKVNQDYTLTVRVRGTLVNALLNDEPAIAWQMTFPREPGLVRLLTYDASAIFYEFSIAPLSPQTEMQEPESGSMSPEAALDLARNQVEDEKFALEESEAKLASIRATMNAMRADWHDSKSADATEQRWNAIRAERAYEVAQQARKLAAAKRSQKKLAPEDKKRAAADKAVKEAEDALQKSQAALAAEIKPDETYSRLSGGKWSATRFQHTGHDDPEVTFPRVSTGRRTALANWMTDERNPLTARVAVNHIWGRHFGEPLVTTTFDFGRNGAAPTHPELLDWLAGEFMNHGWSMKYLHRLIVTSAAYRMTSSTAGGEAALAIDPENRALWRRVPIRLESQVVRDSLLALAGTLDPAMGGPPVPTAQQNDSHRRSLYFFHSNNERNLFLTTFDEASVTECYRREQSIVPQQALALSNSALAQRAAAQIAERLTGLPALGMASLQVRSSVSERSDPPKLTAEDRRFVDNAFRLVTGIEPGDQELAASLAALEEWKKLPQGNSAKARASFIWVLINHNDFVTLR